MKRKSYSTLNLPDSAFTAFGAALVSVFTLLMIPPPAPAQDQSVTISPAQFQRMVYSAHLLTQLEEKPELDASLLVLLELQRRNPHIDPANLAGVMQQALQFYRTNAHAYIRTNGGRDEILAVFLDALRQVPERTNFVSANLSFLQTLITRAQAPTETKADLIHSVSQSALTSESKLTQRQALLDACAARAQGNAAFAATMDSLLSPEALVSLDNTAAQIIGSTNSPLHDNPTMQTLLALSTASGDGSLTVSSNQLLSLFSNETKTFWDAIHTNLAVQVEINQSQPDFFAYLTNKPAMDANLARLAAMRQSQARRIASATAAILVHSKLTEAINPSSKVSNNMKQVASGLDSICRGISTAISAGAATGGAGAVLGLGGVFSGVLNIVDAASGAESPEEAIVREIGNVKTLLEDLNSNMNYRFDRIDQSLTAVFDTLNEQMQKIVIIGGRVDHIDDNVDNIRLSLLDVQTDLYRIERNLATFSALTMRDALVAKMNQALGYEAIAGNPIAYDLYNPNYYVMATDFYTYAFNTAVSEILSRSTTLPFGPEHFYYQLSPGGATNVYAETLNYIKKCLREPAPGLGLSGFPEDPVLANPQDWNAAAGAWLQLAVENPGHFRKYERDVGSPTRLESIIRRGGDLTNFYRSLTFTGTNINRPLYNALQGYYAIKAGNFLDQVDATEQTFVATNPAPWLETWRQWDRVVPRVKCAVTEVRRLPLNPTQITRVAAGTGHGLGLRTDGTVVGWGDNSSGQGAIPAGLSNVVAIAASHFHSMALKRDGTVVAWGANGWGQSNVPQGLSNIVAIATSGIHSLAATSNGTVVAWGYTGHGACDVPAGLSNVVAVAASDFDRDTTSSLALKSDGTVVEWGSPTGIPAGLSNVVAIAAGETHYLALTANGTVVAWGDNAEGQTAVPTGLSNVVAIAAGEQHSLALRADGTTVGWGQDYYGACDFPVELTNAIAIAGGGADTLVVLDHGTVVSFPRTARSAAVPASLTNVVALNAGATHMLALESNGTVTAWGWIRDSQIGVPAGATNVVAIAAGDGHSLALRADTTVLGWGNNYYGQATGVPKLDFPSISTGLVMLAGQPLSNAVAIVAGSRHSLALKADGTVVGWGNNFSGQAATPAGLTDVVAIAAGSFHSLALRANGTVVTWGSNGAGQRNIPAGLTNVVAIAAGKQHSLALQANGRVVAWGNNDYGQATGTTYGAPGSAAMGGQPLTNVVAMAAGADFSCFLLAGGSINAGATQSLVLLPGQLPVRVVSQLREFHIYDYVLTNLDFNLHAPAIEACGAKALLQAVLELGMPYTMERDDVLRGFFYGSEPLLDLDVTRKLLEAERERVQTALSASPIVLRDVAATRFARFIERLNARLDDLAASGQPEIPRLVGHTLRLLNLLRDAWASAPPPAMEISRESNTLRLVLYGEPYAHYTLQSNINNLSVPGWYDTTITNFHNAQSITNAPVSGPIRFYRTKLP